MELGLSVSVILMGGCKRLNKSCYSKLDAFRGNY